MASKARQLSSGWLLVRDEGPPERWIERRDENSMGFSLPSFCRFILKVGLSNGGVGVRRKRGGGSGKPLA